MLIEAFKALNPVLQALAATAFTWFLTALGAAVVFFFRRIEQRWLDAMLGFAAGVMIAASFWSLLAPAIEMGEQASLPGWLPAAIGFLLGGGFLWIVDRTLPHLHLGFPMEEAEGIPGPADRRKENGGIPERIVRGAKDRWILAGLSTVQR